MSERRISTAASDAARSISSSRRLSLERSENDNDELELVEHAFEEAGITASQR